GGRRGALAWRVPAAGVQPAVLRPDTRRVRRRPLHHGSRRHAHARPAAATLTPTDQHGEHLAPAHRTKMREGQATRPVRGLRGGGHAAHTATRQQEGTMSEHPQTWHYGLGAKWWAEINSDMH